MEPEVVSFGWIALACRPFPVRLEDNIVQNLALIRFGAVPDVVRCDVSLLSEIRRGADVVLETDRGLELGVALEVLKPSVEADAPSPAAHFNAIRVATPADAERYRALRQRSQAEFELWEQRITEWGLDLQVIDLEWTLDEKTLVLYVLNERGPECTKLALQAAAAGLGIVTVQPVTSDGPARVPANASGGCGTGGCGCESA